MIKILVVEDEKPIRETLRDILELSGYNVRTAVNGKQGFDEIIEFKPEMVICDVNMPVLNGYDLLAALNQRFPVESLPAFIFLTAKVDLKDIRSGLNLGADDYVTKPFDHTELLSIVKMRLEKRKSTVDKDKDPSSPSSPAASKISGPSSDKEFNKIAVPSSDGLQMISIDEIIRCEADRAYCNFYLSGPVKLTFSKSLKEFEATLLSKNFIKTHKSHIVNVAHIEKYIKGASGHLLMSDKSIVPVAARKKEEVLAHLKQL